MKVYQHYSIYGFSNGYVLGNDTSGLALIVDPSEVTPTMIDQLETKGYTLKAVLVTHNHIHHVRGLKTLMRIYNPAVYASNARIFDIACRKVRDGEIFEEAGFSIEAIALPGHSQDSIAYCLESSLFTGDSLHAGVIGRTTSAFNAQALADRIRTKLLHLSDETLIFPGHGPPTTLGTERKFNTGLQEGYSKRQTPLYDFFV